MVVAAAGPTVTRSSPSGKRCTSIVVHGNAEPRSQPRRFRRGDRQALQDGAVHGLISSPGEREPTI